MPTTAAPIPSCDTAGIITGEVQRRDGPRSGQARPVRCGGAVGHHQLPAKKSCRSDARRRSAEIVGGIVDRLLCGRPPACLRTRASFLVAAGAGAAAIAARTSRELRSRASETASAFANTGAAVCGRVSNTIFSGRLRAERIRMMVLSGSEACPFSGSVGKYRSTANSRATSKPPTKTKYSDDRHGIAARSSA